MDKGNMHVLIVGAGITGLLLAQGCKKNNIPFTVFEKEPSAEHYRLREWGLSLHWAIPHLEKCVPQDLANRLQEAQANPHQAPKDKGQLAYYDATSGEVMAQIPVPFLRRMSRNKLRKLLTDGLDIQYGKDLKSVSYPDDKTVTVTFEDGHQATGTLLIGSDGPRSKVREAIFGSEKGVAKPMGVKLSNLLVNYGDAEKAKFVNDSHEHPMCMGTHDKGYYTWIGVVDVKDPQDPLTWQFQVLNSQFSTENDTGNPKIQPVESLSALKKRAEELCEPFKSAIKWIPDDTKYFESDITQWVPVEFDNKAGRVTLAGDAAHPMAPHRGQGLNHAICDAGNLVDALKTISSGEKSASQGISDYTAEMIKRGSEEVILSEKNAGMVHDLQKVSESPFVKQNVSRQGAGA